mmetsp:Transcript_3226/g.7599  ORF Transcript_3226/g.7599 Transcript_3226/m.7599 type:complete len:313 (+) Transcript_3226:467-1405(+)
MIQPHLVRPYKVGVGDLLVWKAAQQQLLHVSTDSMFELQAGFLETVPVYHVVAVAVEELEGNPQLRLCQGMELSAASHALQPRSCTLMVLLIGVLELEADANRKVVRGMHGVRDHLALRKYGHWSHVKYLQLAAQKLHDVDAAAPRLGDRRGACWNIRGAPKKLVDCLSTTNLPDRARNAPDLAKVPRVEVSHQDHRRLHGLAFRSELREALHQLGHLLDPDRRLATIVRIFGEVGRDDDKWGATSLPSEKNHEAASVTSLATLVIVAINEVQPLSSHQLELRPPPEDSAAIGRAPSRTFVEDPVPAIRETL